MLRLLLLHLSEVSSLRDHADDGAHTFVAAGACADARAVDSVDPGVLVDDFYGAGTDACLGYCEALRAIKLYGSFAGAAAAGDDCVCRCLKFVQLLACLCGCSTAAAAGSLPHCGYFSSSAWLLL